jgi:triosephosphate isomerase
MKNDNIIVANWKSMVHTQRDAKQLCKALDVLPPRIKKRLVICPPAPLIPLVREYKFQTGSQGVSDQLPGSTTGKFPAELLADLKVGYAIVGHSEERASGITSHQVHKQIQRLLNNNIIPIVCIGESQRDSDDPFGELQTMIIETFGGLSADMVQKCIIAYEPIWAIGPKANRPATPHEAHEAILLCKKILMIHVLGSSTIQIKALYGGSVDQTNAREFLDIHDIDGLLIGRASTDSKQLISILNNE